MSYPTTHQQKSAATRLANRMAKRKKLLQGLNERVAGAEGRLHLHRWNEALREAAAQHPVHYALLGDLLPIVNVERSKRDLKPMRNCDLIKVLQYHQCHNKIIHTSKNGKHYRAWHKAHAIDICTSLLKHSPHEKTENIWAVLPQKYRNDPNWVTIREASRILGCTIIRVSGFAKERANYRVFLHPETKRKLVYLPELADAVNWRFRSFILSHCTPEQACHIFSTARKKVKRTPIFSRTLYYCPELAHL